MSGSSTWTTMFARLLRPSCSSLPSKATPTTTSLPSTATRPFSSSPSLSRRTRDNNKLRGVSFLRRTGFRKRQHQIYRGPPLPQPNLEARTKLKPEVEENHGLWQFFPTTKTSISYAADEGTYGRHWSLPELRRKSWEDLHKLWWVCFKDRSRVATIMTERQRTEVMHGQVEFRTRMGVLKQTQKHIKRVLTERWYAWEDARKVAVDDPSVDLANETDPYNPELDAKDPLFDESPAPSRSYGKTVQAERTHSAPAA